MIRRIKALILVAFVFNLVACTNMEIGKKVDFTQKIGKNAPDEIILSWTKSPVDTQTVSWKSSINQEAKVEYFEIDNQDVMVGEIVTIPASIENFDGKFLNSAIITGLKENTNYAYRVGNGKKWSTYSKFKSGTDDNIAFKLAIFGDSQSGDASNPNYNPFNEVLKTLYSKEKELRFAISLGDLVEIGEDMKHWYGWFDAVDGYFNNTSFMAVQGNHENLSLEEAGDVKPKTYLKEMFLPENGPEGQKEQVYSFEFGDAKFIVLNSQVREEEKYDSETGEKEAIWLENELKTSKKTWNIVFFHKPIFYSHASRSNDNVKKLFQSIIDKYHVDLVFSGHDHAVSRTFPIKANDMYEKPSNGTVYYTVGRTGDKVYSSVRKKIWNDFFYDSFDNTSYLTLEINGKTAKVNTYAGDGKLVDEYLIDKEADTVSSESKLPEKSDKEKIVVYGKELKYDGVNTDAITYNNKTYIALDGILKFTEGRLKKTEDKIKVNIYDINVSFYLDPNKKPTINAKEIDGDNLYIDGENVYISEYNLKNIYGFKIEKSKEQNIIYLER